MRDVKIKDVPLVESLTGQEKIPVSDGSGSPKAINVQQILDKTPVPDLTEYVKIGDLVTNYSATEYEYVDLGLPSGTLWATCNVGANSPEEAGEYYAWGETDEKQDASWETYKWCKGTATSIFKYCTDSSYGTVDNKTILDPEDDVAHVKWGGNWRMPTRDEIEELIDNCTREWTVYNGVNGHLVTGPNSNSIFLPAAGRLRSGTNLDNSGSYGYYWSATLVEDNSGNAYYLRSNNDSLTISSRYIGFTVRPVMTKQPILSNYYTKEEVDSKGYALKSEISTDYLTEAPSNGLYARQNGKWVKIKDECKVPTIDLSMQDIHGNTIEQTTANCYVVNKSGDYKFPLVYGNAIKNGETNTASYTKVEGENSHDFVNHLDNVITSPYIYENEGCVPASVELTMSDEDNLFSNLELVDNYIQFSVNTIPAIGANSIISVLDADGVVMWSWHIWVWPDDLTPVTITNSTSVDYDILPVNLGSKWDSDSKNKIKNWYYQFGRPTPMLCPKSYNSVTYHTNYGTKTFTVSDVANSIGQSIQNPQTFYKSGGDIDNYNWFSADSSKTYNLWDANCTNTGTSDNTVVKTIYDPCPVGYHMPNGNTFTGFSTSNVVGSFTNGWYFKKNSSDTTGVFFPASGQRYYSSGSLNNVGSNSCVWLSSAVDAARVHCLFLSDYNVSAQGNYPSSFGFSVRPVKEI